MWLWLRRQRTKIALRLRIGLEKSLPMWRRALFLRGAGGKSRSGLTETQHVPYVTAALFPQTDGKSVIDMTSRMMTKIHTGTTIMITASLLGLSPALAEYPILPYSESPSAPVLESKCLVRPSKEHAMKALALLNQRKEGEAYKYAGAAWEYQGSCKSGAGAHRWSGDAMLVIAIVLAPRGKQHEANIDAGIATAVYQECVESRHEIADHPYCIQQ